MVPELVGRFPVLVPFHSLSVDLLIRVLREASQETSGELFSAAQLDHRPSEASLPPRRRPTRVHPRRPRGDGPPGRAEEDRRPRSPVSPDPARICFSSILENVLLDAKFDCPGSKRTAVVVDDRVVRREVSYTEGRLNGDIAPRPEIGDPNTSKETKTADDLEADKELPAEEKPESTALQLVDKKAGDVVEKKKN